MTRRSEGGFTIIEVITFLAISALMMSALMVAISGGINRERYRDAVNSFYDYLQGQYNLVDNVRNEREVVIDGCGATEENLGTVGTSDCTLVGRFIYSNADSSAVTAVPVVATADVSELNYENMTNTEVLEEMRLKPYQPPTNEPQPSVVDAYELLWQTAVVSPDDTPRPFQILLVRSPVSNVVHTYINVGGAGTGTLSEQLASTHENAADQTVVLCVEASGLMPEKTGLTVDPNGVNSSAIQVASAESCTS